MARYMAGRLEQYGFTGAQVHLYGTVDELVEAVRRGEVHWISETPYTAARLIRETGSQALVTKWKNHQPQYQSLIYTLADSGIDELNDLVGKRIAFEHPASFSSYFLPRQILERQGLSLVKLEHTNDPVPPGQVGYLFSRNEKNNALWVAKGIAAAGALNNGDWENRARVPARIQAKLQVIHRSEFYPRAFEIATPALSEAAASALRDELLAMSENSHADLLARYEQTGGFSALNPKDHEFLLQLGHGREDTPE
ncbi:phosphate/phosphite/phosphonate ABC transporter substrate-binding protein [Marinobacterium sp. YM272]|uniref:phosphate/phosphite/phosphonate ABC transporter substrate-binding protein n=1 Tax=Marinobacterium sp. YM272 TaxID=3421654 RepID=UPI003D7F5811